MFFFLTPEGNVGTGFSISDEGFLSVASALEAETTSFYSLEITATDRHPSQPLSNTAKVTVTVTGKKGHLVIYNGTFQITEGVRASCLNC